MRKLVISALDLARGVGRMRRKKRRPARSRPKLPSC